MANRTVHRCQRLFVLRLRGLFRSQSMIAVGVIMTLTFHLTSQQRLLQQLRQNGGRNGSEDIEIFPDKDAVELVRYTVETHFQTCHILIAEEGNSRMSGVVMRSLQEAYIPQANIDLKSVSLDLVQRLRQRDEKMTCRLFIFDLTNNGDDASLTIEFMENLRFFLVRHVSVVFVGSRDLLYRILRSKTLWNTYRVLYLVIQQQESWVQEMRGGLLPLLQDIDQPVPVTIYIRCLYCNQGDSGIQLVDKWNPGSGFIWGKSFFQDEFKDMLGHRLIVVQNKLYPFVSFTKNKNEQNSIRTVTPRDAIEVRAMFAVAKALNFTYEMRLPWDDKWGSFTESGNWTGMVGTLQHHKADFAMTLRYTRGRMKVIDYSMGYIQLPLVIITTTPPPPPPYLAIIRPLSVDIWIYVVLSVMSAGLILRSLQYSWTKASKEPGMGLDSSIMSTFSTIFEEPAHTMPTNTSGLMFMGWWWIYCTLITVVYKSSLVSHLSVPLVSTTIDTFDQLLAAGGWTWGYKNNHSSDYDWFKFHKDPIIQRIFQDLKIMTVDEQVERMKRAKHAVVHNPIVFMAHPAVTSIIKLGYSPFYFSKSEYNTGGVSWAFRQNAPFKHAIDLMIHRLVEAGLISKWVRDLSGTIEKKYVEQTPAQKKDDGLPPETADIEQGKSDQVVLSLSHLQSAFYALFLGFAASSLAFVGEMVQGPQRS